MFLFVVWSLAVAKDLSDRASARRFVLLLAVGVQLLDNEALFGLRGVTLLIPGLHSSDTRL